MNAVVPKFDSSVPAFLQQAGFLALNTKAAAGLSTGSPPKLSFRGSRFRFVGSDGTETPVNDIIDAPDPSTGQMVKMQTGGTTVDVVVIDASQWVSKFYYDKAYDPNAEDMAPACFSDNGVGPSVRSSTPQNLTCAGCPKNAWGSKITPQGTQVKACNDVKKLAVIPVNNMAGPAYVLGIPGASLKSWTSAVKALTDRGIPIPALVIRLSFDGQAEFPKLTFSPTRWINEQEAQHLQELFGSEEVAELTGAKDTPIAAMPAGQIAHQPQQAVYVPAQAQQPVQQQAAYANPAAQQQFVPAQQPFVTPAAAPAPAFLQPAAPAAQPAPAAAPAPRRRGRAAAPAAPQAAQPAPAAPPQTSVPLTAAAPPADIGGMLDSIMAGRA